MPALSKRLNSTVSKTDIVKVPLNIVVVDKNLKGEVEIQLNDQFQITQDVIGAIKHINGVSHVEPMKS